MMSISWWLYIDSLARMYLLRNANMHNAYPVQINIIIIHQTHYEKSDLLRAFNQFTIAFERVMIKATSAADIAFFMSSLKSVGLPSP